MSFAIFEHLFHSVIDSVKVRLSPAPAIAGLSLVFMSIGVVALPATSNIAALTAIECTNDSAGANDEPGQKDLTRMCVDYAGAPSTIAVSWNWDELSVSGANTLDACSLYDTDGDGNANYSLCVSSNDGVTSTTILYSCGDDSADRCTSPVNEVTPFASTCSVSVQPTDPFSAGNAFPQDLAASLDC